jgi:hypothetical protein
VLKRLLSLTFILALGLAACRSGGATVTATPTASPVATATVAPADTATEAAPAASETATGLLATDTPIATATVAPTEVVSATAAVSGTATAAVTQGAGTDKAAFVADTTVPDGTTFTPGQTFVKTWQLKNTGGNDWSTAYAVVFVRGDQMGGPASVPLSGTVAAGATTEVSVSLSAPTKVGTFTGFWMLRNAAGKLFGIGADANQPVYLKINVGGAAGTPQPTGVPGTISVSAATLGVAPASFSGACPQTYTFTGNITSAGAGKISYKLEATSDKPGFVFDLPAPVESVFTDAGPRTFTVNYQLTFTGSVSGQATLHVLTPNDLSSAKVSFSLACASTPGTGTPTP